MIDRLRGRSTAFITFFLIGVLVAGGLGWVTTATLRLETEQLEIRSEVEQYDKLRLALWRLDSLIAPALTKEDSRPYNHYSAVFAPATTLQSSGQPWPPGT